MCALHRPRGDTTRSARPGPPRRGRLSAHWQTLDTGTDKLIPLPTEQPPRYVAMASVERWDNNRWMGTEYGPDGSRSC
ncbi:hypothetical protein ACFWVP_21405 [Streptomyces sp. NPDC058637]|uniref:hypothetical protein n=1 Tax=Streptomyces sp. NPDC058637 TaxID=3346569 RepID=UPI003652EF9B